MFEHIEKKLIAVRLDADVLKKIQDIATANSRSVSWVIRKLLRDSVESHHG
jgi:predicted transcriptional regulator